MAKQKPEGERQLDLKATVAARRRQEAGVDRINTAFGMTIQRDADGNLLPPPPNVLRVLAFASDHGDPSGRGRPFRMRPGVPPIRDAEHQRKHVLRKISHDSRRRNRP
jgi:hypothetical protein